MRTDPQALRTASTEAGVSGRTIVLCGLAYLGVTAGLPEMLDVEVRSISLHLVVALTLGWVGWHGITMWPALRTYMRLAGALAVWFCISGIASWDLGAFVWSLTAAVWLLFIIPGLANLLRNATNRKALLVGVIGAALAYAFTGLTRLLLGREIFDLPTPSRGVLLGAKRGFVNARLLYVIPFLTADALGVLRRLRWVALAAAVGGIIVSGGRSGLLGLVVVVISYVVVQPGVFGRVRALLVAVMLALIALMAVGEFGGQAVVAQNRLLSYLRGERTASDQYRELQLRRAWHVGLENPVFGIGYNRMQGADDPVLDEARTGRLRRLAQEERVHNTYAQIFAEFGVPAVIAFLVLLLSVIAAGYAHRSIPEIRAATSGLVGVMVLMLFHPIALTFLYFPLAYIVGALGDDEAPGEPEAVWGGSGGRRVAPPIGGASGGRRVAPPIR